MSGRTPGRGRIYLFLALTTLVVGVLVAYTIKQRRPLIPADFDHARSRTATDCIVCHSPTGPNARGPNHPLNDRCFSCHERA